jgi:hypothetical protein
VDNYQLYQKMSSSQWLGTDLKTFSKKGYRGKCTDEVASNFTLGHNSITSSSFSLLLEPLNEREMAPCNSAVLITSMPHLCNFSVLILFGVYNLFSEGCIYNFVNNFKTRGFGNGKQYNQLQQLILFLWQNTKHN